MNDKIKELDNQHKLEMASVLIISETIEHLHTRKEEHLREGTRLLNELNLLKEEAEKQSHLELAAPAPDEPKKLKKQSIEELYYRMLSDSDRPLARAELTSAAFKANLVSNLACANRGLASLVKSKVIMQAGSRNSRWFYLKHHINRANDYDGDKRELLKVINTLGGKATSAEICLYIVTNGMFMDPSSVPRYLTELHQENLATRTSKRPYVYSPWMAVTLS